MQTLSMPRKASPSVRLGIMQPILMRLGRLLSSGTLHKAMPVVALLRMLRLELTQLSSAGRENGGPASIEEEEMIANSSR